MGMSSRQTDGWYLFAIVVDETSAGDTVLWEDSQGSDGINEKGFSTISTVQLPQMSSSFSYFLKINHNRSHVLHMGIKSLFFLTH